MYWTIGKKRFRIQTSSFGVNNLLTAMLSVGQSIWFIFMKPKSGSLVNSVKSVKVVMHTDPAQDKWLVMRHQDKRKRWGLSRVVSATPNLKLESLYMHLQKSRTFLKTQCDKKGYREHSIYPKGKHVYTAALSNG